jgi:hypothetical protein
MGRAQTNRSAFVTTTALWRRLDAPGHDACYLSDNNGGWQLQGNAVFRHDRGPAHIEYLVVCDSAWRCRYGEIRGWIAQQRWDLRIERTDVGGWMLNDTSVQGLQDCFDLDLGFTPATNLLQLRRVNLALGKSADVPVAWLDLPEASLQRVPQRYERRSDMSYWYESPTFNYSALLEVADSGFVSSYPQLWLMED